MEIRERKPFGYGEVDKLGLRAAKAWYTHLGMNCIDERWECASGSWDLVMQDGEDIVFVTVYSKSFRMPDVRSIGNATRHSMETRAIAYLDAHRDIARARISFDVTYIAVMREDRALMRLHRGVLNTATGCPAATDGTMTYEDIVTNVTHMPLDEFFQQDDVVEALEGLPDEIVNDPPFDAD